ncbi:MAG: DUF7948 domain-containing protein, partial [bacterium]
MRVLSVVVVSVFAVFVFASSVFAEGIESEMLSERILSWQAAASGFERNLGQVGDFEGNRVDDVLARLRLKDFSLYVTTDGVSVVMYQIEQGEELEVNEGDRVRRVNREPGVLRYARFDLELVEGAMDASRVIYEDELPGYTNYYLPWCSDGILFVRSYKRLRVRDVYPGIDWVFRIEGGQLHHEFEVSPGADYSRIRMRVRWADLDLEDGRRLRFRTALGEVVDGEIYAYEGGRELDVSYRVTDDKEISFDVRNYLGREKLIIDPPLSLVW